MNHKSLNPLYKNFSTFKIIRYLFVIIILIAGLLYLLSEAHRLPVNDFIGYWSAARIFTGGGNPYSPDELLSMQIKGGLTFEYYHIVYNPPWLLPILIPFSFFNRPNAQVIWFFGQIAVLLLCSNLIWLLYGGKIHQRWVAWLATFTFGAVIAAVVFQGQISPLILLGLVGFLTYIDKPGKEWLSGVYAVLLTIKPQVVFLFFIAFLFWVIFNKKWSILISFLSVLAILSAIAILIDHQIFYQYFQCILKDAPSGWATPTIGTYLRLLFNPTEFLLSFVTPALGTMWLVYYWIGKKNSWEWKSEIPMILFISVITSSYIWTYDMLVLLLPIIMALIWQLYENKKWISILLSIIYILINLIYLRLHLFLEDSKFIWFAPVLFAWYLIAYAMHIRQKNMRIIPESV
jgi:hypothetical protein